MAKSILSNFIRRRDWFGQPINLYFNKKGNVHNTLIGGYFSILLEAVFGIYCYIYFR